MRRCEALVETTTASGIRYVPCGVMPADLHHKLTRARGGLILDHWGETYHHLYLCRTHHSRAHDAPAFENGLLIRGLVTSEPNGKPIYSGPDEYLSEKYGQVHTEAGVNDGGSAGWGYT